MKTYQTLLDTTLCDKVYQRLAASRWFSSGIPVTSTNKTDRHNITEIALKVALNTIKLTLVLPNHLFVFHVFKMSISIDELCFSRDRLENRELIQCAG